MPSSSSLLASKIQKENEDRPRRSSLGAGEMVVSGEDGLTVRPVQPETRTAVLVSAEIFRMCDRQQL